ncbi:MAG TPA: LacI family DNA-binding transcriptional regulator [Jatrophihabitans sp.]|jgi:DNA-binding LacI/PurR family transcriptional regulator|nr:LacI family DNA-binding transcriptional regulator [Jatrophihabitans sp.]
MSKQSGRPPTLEDVAARAGVSRALVSIVIRGVPGASEATRQRVLETAEELGYRPDGRARLLAAGRSRLIGVTLALNNPFHSDVTEGIYAAAEACGYQVVLSAVTGRRAPERAVETLLDYRCEAAILLGPLVARQALQELAQRLPVVVVGQPSHAPAADVVRVSDADGVGLAVDHLRCLGHRLIAHVDGGRSAGAAQRRAAFRAAHRRHGLPGQPHVVAGGPGEEDGATAARRLVSDGLPTAVLAYNDACAVGLLDMFVRLGVSVPRQVSVVGYDDSPVGRLSYRRLTTVSQDGHQLASLAVQRLVSRLAGSAPAERQLLVRPALVLRGTTAEPAGGRP